MWLLPLKFRSGFLRCISAIGVFVLLLAPQAGFAQNAAQEEIIELPDFDNGVTPPEPIMPKVALPSDEALLEVSPPKPSPETAETPQPEELSKEERQEIVKAAASGDDVFFDAEALVDSSESGYRDVPRKMDPVKEPGSRFVIVKKNYGSASRQAQLIAAERAIEMGRYDSALELYDALYSKYSNDPNVLLGRAIALQHTGQTESAIVAYEQLLKERPNNLEAKVNMLGLMGLRYPAVALTRLQRLQEEHPDDAGVVAQVGISHANMGRYDDAVRYLGMAAGIEPDNPAHVFNMAVISDRAGNKAEAIKYYEQALEKDTLYGGGHIPRGQVFERIARLR